MDSTKTYFYEEVLNMLEAGYSMTDIAKQITADMNEAQAHYNAKRQEALLKERKMAQVAKIYDMVQAYMKEHAPDLEQTPDTSREEAIAQVYCGLEDFIAIMREAIKEIQEAPTAAPTKSADEAKPVDPQRSITNFLSEMGLL
jgi:cell pole-organizing protein PopZ